MASGPIYETKLKAMRSGPQGLERITAWKKRIGSLPLIAIGGITPDRARGVIEAGADSVAVITDFFTAPHPEARVGLWLDWAAHRPPRDPGAQRTSRQLLPRDRAPADVAAAEAARPIDLADRRISALLRLCDRLAQRRDVQHAAAIGNDPVAIAFRPGMEDLDALDRARQLRDP